MTKTFTSFSQVVSMRVLTLSFLTLSFLCLTACGFQLRSDNNKVIRDAAIQQSALNQAAINRVVTVHTTDDNVTIALKQPLIKNLNMLGIQTLTLSPDDTTGHIHIDSLNIRKYELVGVLTEMRVVMVAEVTYDVFKDGKRMTHTQPLQIEKSYQYNEASVSVEDRQGKQIRAWLYEALARRIADQYMALSD